MMETLCGHTSAPRSSDYLFRWSYHLPRLTSKNLFKWTNLEKRLNDLEKRLNDPRFTATTARIFGEAKPISSCVRSALKKSVDPESSNSSQHLDCPPANKKPRFESSSSHEDMATQKPCDSPCTCCSAIDRNDTKYRSLCERLLLRREKHQRLKELSGKARYTYKIHKWLQNVPPPLVSQALHREGSSSPSRNAFSDSASSYPDVELSETEGRDDSSFDSATCVGDVQDQSVLKNSVAPFASSPSHNAFSDATEVASYPPVLGKRSLYRHSNASNASVYSNSPVNFVNENSNDSQFAYNDYCEYIRAKSKFESSSQEAENAYDDTTEKFNFSVVVPSQSDESEVQWSKNTSSSSSDSEVEYSKNPSASSDDGSEVQWAYSFSDTENENASRWADYKCFENICEYSQELPVSTKSDLSTAESTDSDYSDSDASVICLERRTVRRDSTVSENSSSGSAVPYSGSPVLPNSMTYVVSSVPVNTYLEEFNMQFKRKNDDFRQIRGRAQRLRTALLLTQKARCKELKIVVPKLPDYIYQSHLQSKPIMLRNIAPLASHVKCL